MIRFLSTAVLMAVATVKGYSNKDVQRLQTDLFTNYSKHVRPVRNQSHAITVGINVYLMYIHELVGESFGNS